MTDLPHIRAVRNNNPGNINAGTNWQGLMPRNQMTADQFNEPRFAVFLTPQWGFRAMATIIHTYRAKDGITTLRGVVSRWAPPGENNTGAYLNAVCLRTQWQPDAPYPFDKLGNMAALLKAISTQEVGTWAFQQADLENGVASCH